MSSQETTHRESGTLNDVDEPVNRISPLPGEPGIPDVSRPRRSVLSRKGLLAAGLLILLLVIVAGSSIQYFTARGKTDGEVSKTAGNQPAAATSELRKLEMPPARPVQSAASAPKTSPRIPALVPTEEEVEPIGVRRSGTGSATPPAKVIPPEDAPVMLVTSPPGTPVAPTAKPGQPVGLDSRAVPAAAAADAGGSLSATTRNLEDYQRRLQGMLDTLTRGAALAARDAIAEPGGLPPVGAAAAGSLLGKPPGSPFDAGSGGSQSAGGQRSATPRVAASMLGNRSLTLPKGTAFTCALKTKVISAASGLVGCQVQRNVYSDDGRVLLIERGSHLDGEYRVVSVKPGTVRVPVLWNRIRTPHGVTVDIESPATGQLGEAGIDGHVDNRWGERIGAAMLLSLIDDSVKLTIQNQANDREGDTIVLPSTTANTSKLAEKVLDSTINIPPLIYQNQGGIVGIYVARDVDFSSVYELKPLPREAAR
jgi:type IV secretion system protein VirB10